VTTWPLLAATCAHWPRRSRSCKLHARHPNTLAVTVVRCLRAPSGAGG
jgi:hypothetical protein